MKVALLSNVTTSILEGLLKKDCGIWAPTGFGAWVETSLNPPDELVAFKPDVIYLLLDAKYAAFAPELVEEAKASLARHFPSVAIVVPDLSRLAADFGPAFYDEKMWKLGKMPWSMAGLRELKKLITPIKKVLALDLDNTLWSGVIGEDGVLGVTPNQRLLDEIRALKARGVVLTLLSKNNPEDVEPAFGSILAREDFVGMKFNWDPKPDNLVALAQELNVGTDAFVFVDDNPAERAEMRARRPEVCVADFPPQLEAFFPRRELTKEDLDKTAQYQAEAKRKELAATLSIDDYLKSLEIWTDVHPIVEAEIPRVAQLSQKTNQFNVLTNRYAEDDIRRFAADANELLVTLHAGDKFGDQGLVAFVRCRINGEVADIVDWVMSCRAMNRRIEFTVQTEVERLLFERGVSTLTACWRKTLKNVPVKDLFEKFGFTCENVTDAEKHYRKDLKMKSKEEKR